MGARELFWIDTGVYGLGKDQLKNGDPIDINKFDKKKLKKFIEEGKIGQLKVSASLDDKEIIKKLQDKISDLEKNSGVDNEEEIIELEESLDKKDEEIDTLKDELEELKKSLGNGEKGVQNYLKSKDSEIDGLFKVINKQDKEIQSLQKALEKAKK